MKLKTKLVYFGLISSVEVTSTTPPTLRARAMALATPSGEGTEPESATCPSVLDTEMDQTERSESAAYLP